MIQMADEYIRADTTINAIDNLINEAATGTMARTLFNAKDAIYNQQRYLLPVDRWISVDDRLPEYDKIVLVWYSYDGIWGETAGYGISWYHGKWNINELNQTGDNLEVLYWMYVPEPPKDGEI